MIFKLSKIGRHATRAFSRRSVLKAKPPVVKATDVCGNLAWLAIKALAAEMLAPKPSFRPMTVNDVLNSQLSFFWIDDEVHNQLAFNTKEKRLLKAKARAKLRKKHGRFRSKQKPKGFQYSLGIRTRSAPRKLTFTRKAPKEVGVGNDFTWDMTYARRLHAALLADSLASLREYLQLGSLKVAEVWKWISRRGHDEPFAFDTCCILACEFPEFFDDWDLQGLDSEALRDHIEGMIRRRFRGKPFALARVLKAALVDVEQGVTSAIEWVCSDDPGPLSFVECCEAFGFTPDDARRELRLSVAQPMAHVA